MEGGGWKVGVGRWGLKGRGWKAGESTIAAPSSNAAATCIYTRDSRARVWLRAWLRVWLRV